MDSVGLDTNVLLDFFAADRPEHPLAVSLFRELRLSNATVCVVATSMKDVYCVLGRTHGRAVAQGAVAAMMATMTVLPVDDACCRTALASTEPDFGDGIVRAAAETAQVTYLISRDRRAFVGSRVSCLTPAEALHELAHKRPADG